jgi:hypothetical protein
LLPDDIDGFTISPAVDVDVIQILETMQSSRPDDNIEAGIASIDPSDATLSDEFP